MRNDSRGRPGPLLGATALLAVTLSVIVMMSMRATEGRFVYALDDAYIHMAMAQNLVRHGVWGVTPLDFSSASSSPLWTLLLAAVYGVFGTREVAGFVLNVIFAVALLWYVARMAGAHGLSQGATLILLSAVVVLTPLPTLAVEGLEHILQILLDLMFLVHAVRLVVAEGRAARADRWLCLALAPLVTSVRYEGVFLVLVIALLLALRRRLADAAAVAAFGMIPVIAYGLVSVGHGWYFFPNSVLLKAQSLGGLPHLTDARAVLLYAVRALRALVATPHLLVPMAAALVWLVSHLRAGAGWTIACVSIVTFTCVAALHLQFAGLGWLYRYESYLVTMGLVVVATCAPDGVVRGALAPPVGARPRLVAVAVASLAFVLAAPLISRGLDALKAAHVATANIYQQQYQMGLFFREFYPGEAVAANDIGAVGFLHDGPLLDLVGLATMPVAAARRARTYDADMMARFADERGVKVAILYENWFKSGVPKGWRKAGQWTIPRRVAAADETVNIYAVAPGEYERLIDNLRRFAGRLPAAVAQQGAYVEAGP